MTMSNSLKNNDYSNISLTKNNSLSDKFGMSDELGLRGTVIQVGDGILKIAGASEAMAGEVLLVETKAGDVPALALNLETQAVGAVLLGVDTGVLFGDTVRCSGRLAQIRVISDLANQSSEPSMLFGLLDSLGKLVQPYSPPISSMTASDTSDTSLEQPGQAAIANYALSELQSIEAAAPSIIDRLSVSVPLATGILAIDAMVPIGRGQRQLIIGDRQTGKTSIATDAIINQRDSDVACFYIGIGQKASSVGSVMAEVRGAKMFTATFIAATPDAPAAAQYLAPYSGAAIAEAYMNKLQVDTLVVYDDLSKHACAYREMCLLLRRPPGREAFPADVFYLHSRLLERSANLARGGSMTALPIIETQAEDLSAYIPTNVISITDGQIYLSTELFNASLRPAINAGLSVSRVGAAAQSSLLKGVAGSLKLTVAQLAELETFSQFSADLDADTQKRLAFGQRLKEILKQRQGNPLSEVAQVALIWSVFFGALGACPIGDLAAAKQALVNCKSDCQEIVDSINRTNNVS